MTVMGPLRDRYAKWVFAAALVLGLVGLVRSQQYFGGLLRAMDDQFHYALAHSLVFDLDVDLTNNLKLTPVPVVFDPDLDGSWSAVPRRADGGFRMKQPMGLSLLQSPFLAIGHAVRRAAEAMGFEVAGPPGYSVIEVWSVAVGMLLIVVAGLTLAYACAAETCGRWPAAIGVLSCWMGTSLFYYTVVQPFMAHSVSFAILVILMAVTRPLFRAGAVNWQIFLLGAILAVTLLVRPQQVLIGVFLIPVLLSVLWNRRPGLWAFGAVAGVALCVAAAGLQVWMNSTQFGAPSLSAYQASGEHFMRTGGPSELGSRLQVALVSSQRGLLWFSPIVIVATLGYVRFFRLVPRYVWPVVGNAVAQILLIALWSPWQGDSFGMRMWADNAHAVVFGVAVLFGYAAHRRRAVLGAAAFVSLLATTLLLASHVGLIGAAASRFPF